MQEEYKRIELSDDYMFAEIMRQDKETCRKVLEIILGFEIESLEYVENERFLKSDTDSKAVRLDVVARSTGAVYDIEMQKVNVGNIPRRARYYQSQIAVSELDKGVEYDKLKDSYVIFICGFDLFGMGEYVYRFENCDMEKKLAFGDGSKIVVVNTKGTRGEISDELKEFIAYIDRPEEIAKSPNSDLVKDLESRVINKNKDKNWREKRMRAEVERVDYKNIGIQEGIAIGLERGLERGINQTRQIFKLSLKGKSIPEIAIEMNMNENQVRDILQ